MPETTTEGQQADFCHGLGRRQWGFFSRFLWKLSRMLQKCCLDRRRNADVKTNDDPRGWKNHSQLTFDLNFIPHTHTHTHTQTHTHTHTHIYIYKYIYLKYSLYPKLGDPIGWNIRVSIPIPGLKRMKSAVAPGVGRFRAPWTWDETHGDFGTSETKWMI